MMCGSGAKHGEFKGNAASCDPGSGRIHLRPSYSDTGNSATNGGAILSQRTIALLDCTIRSNTATRATGGGGGIYNQANASIEIVGGCLDGNVAAGQGGAIYNEAGHVTITGAVLSSNRCRFWTCGTPWKALNSVGLTCTRVLLCTSAQPSFPCPFSGPRRLRP